MDSPYRDFLAIAFGALQNAARISQSIISSTDKGVLEKDDLSPVTVADFAIQALLTATFKAAFPHDTFVGEESASELRENTVLLDRVWGLLLNTKAGDASAVGSCKLPASKEEMCDLIDQCGSSSPGGQGSGRTWIFDPIDGTKTYVAGQLYAINIGMLDNGKQVLGAVGCPNMSMDAKAPLGNADIDASGEGCIMFAVKGHGAFVRPMSGQVSDVEPRRLPSEHPHVSEAEAVQFVTCTSVVDSALPGIHSVIALHVNGPDVAFPHCDLVAWVLRWASLALGLGNATAWVYKRLDRRAKAWDHAGAMLLFEETGGIITDVRGRPIDLAAGRKLVGNTGFVAARGEALHARLLKAVREVLKEQGHTEYLEE